MVDNKRAYADRRSGYDVFEPESEWKSTVTLHAHKIDNDSQSITFEIKEVVIHPGYVDGIRRLTCN